MQPISPVSITSRRFSSPKRFAANTPAQRTKPVIQTLHLSGAIGIMLSMLGWGVFSATLPTSGDERSALSVTEPISEIKKGPTQILMDKFVPARPEEAQKIQQIELFSRMLQEFAYASDAKDTLNKILPSLNEQDLAATQKIIQSYQKQPQSLETCRTLYRDWSNQVLVPHIGATETLKYQDTVDQFFKKIALRKNLDGLFFSALSFSLAIGLLSMAGRVLASAPPQKAKANT